MRKRTVVIASAVTAGFIVLAGAFAFAGPRLYRGSAADVAPVPTVTAVQDASGRAVNARQAAGTWHVEDGSFAGYRIDEVLNGTEMTVVGRTEQVTGQVLVDDGGVAEASITVDVASITTDSGSRDSAFRNTVMQTFRHPRARFELTAPIAAEPVREGRPQRVRATGELTLAGVTRPVEITVDAVIDGDRAHIAGSVPVALADYGIEPPHLGFVRVEDSGSVEFSLVLGR